jgi:hypothetical protein
MASSAELKIIISVPNMLNEKISPTITFESAEPKLFYFKLEHTVQLLVNFNESNMHARLLSV